MGIAVVLVKFRDFGVREAAPISHASTIEVLNVNRELEACAMGIDQIKRAYPRAVDLEAEFIRWQSTDLTKRAVKSRQPTSRRRQQRYD